MQSIYLLQNWKFGSNSLEEFKNWDTEGKILKKLQEQDVYVHTDSQWGFLILSLDKEKLLEFANKRRNEEIAQCESKLKWLKDMNFKQ